MTKVTEEQAKKCSASEEGIRLEQKMKKYM